MDTADLNAEKLIKFFYSHTAEQRADSYWRMSQETLDLIKELPQVDKAGATPGIPGLLLGRPIHIEPDAQGIALLKPFVSVGISSQAPAKPRRIDSRTFFKALVDADVFREDDGNSIRRIVIDAQVGCAIVIHVERFGDSRLLELAPVLTGVEIREVDAPEVTA